MRKAYSVIERKEGNCFYFFTIETSSFSKSETENLNGSKSLNFIITKFDELFIIQRKDYTNNKIVEVKLSYNEALLFCTEALKEKYKNSSYMEYTSEYITLDNSFADLLYLYSKIYKKHISFDSLELFDKEYLSIVKNINEKIEILISNYIQPIYIQYKNRNRKAELKEDTLYNLTNLKYSTSFIRKFFDSLLVLDNLVFKNEEFVLFLDTYFFKGYSNVSKNSYIGETKTTPTFTIFI